MGRKRAMKRTKVEQEFGCDFDMDSLCSEIAKNTGGNTLDSIETIDYYIDTGNLAINYCCSGKFIGGGLPGKRVIEAFGPESSGKSFIGSNTLYGAQQIGAWCILLDCENASNGEFMQKTSHLNLGRVLRYTPTSLERAFRQIHVVVNAIRERELEIAKEKKIDVTKVQRPIYVVFDSLTQPPCERELRENDLPLDFSLNDWKKLVGAKEQPGERAKIISAEMRKLTSILVEKNVTCYFVNQVRDKIGVLYGNPETTPGGNAMKFYASVRIRTDKKKKIENDVLGNYCGINIQVRNVKNKVFKPFVVVDDIKLYFEHGVDPLSGLLSALVSDGRVIMKGAGYYEVSDKYLPDGKENYKFRSSKAANRLDMDVLLDCPALVDAKSSKEVEDYINKWRGGFDATESDEFTEKELSESV